MDITTEAPLSSRAQRSSAATDLAAVWPPLVELAEAAANTAGSVAISRGFDRNSKNRARALRERLGEQGLSAIEVTPLPDSEGLLEGHEITAVVNLVGAGSWQPYRLAAKLRAPVLTPNPTEGEPDAEATRDVVGVTGDEGLRDAALSHVAVRPENAEQASLTLTSEDEPLTVPGGWVVITPQQGQLQVQLGGPDYAEQTFTTDRLRVETADAPHRLVRDEAPIAEFEGALTFTAEPGGLVVRPV